MNHIFTKKEMTEEDIKFHYISPAIVSKWNKNKITMETSQMVKLTFVGIWFLEKNQKRQTIYYI